MKLKSNYILFHMSSIRSFTSVPLIPFGCISIVGCCVSLRAWLHDVQQHSFLVCLWSLVLPKSLALEQLAVKP